MKQFLAKNAKYGNVDFICQCIDDQLLLTAICQHGKVTVAILPDSAAFPRIDVNKTTAYAINCSMLSRFDFPMQIVTPIVEITNSKLNKTAVAELVDSLIMQLFRAYVISYSELHWTIESRSDTSFHFSHGRQRVQLPIANYEVRTGLWTFSFTKTHALIEIEHAETITPKVLQQLGIDLNKIPVGFEVLPGAFDITRQCVVLENVAGLDSPRRPLLLNVKPDEYFFFTVFTLQALNPNLRFAEPTDILFCQPRQDEPIKTVETPYGTFKVQLAKSHSFYVVVE